MICMWTRGVAVALLVCATPAFGLTDDFNDNDPSPIWVLEVDKPGQLDIDEINQRVEVVTDGSAGEKDDAFFFSDGPAGFVLKTNQDFDISISFTMTGFTSVGSTGDLFGFAFGVGLDPEGEDSAGIAWGLGNGGILGTISRAAAAFRESDVQTNIDLDSGPSLTDLPTTITFRMTYDVSAESLVGSIDELSISHDFEDLITDEWGGATELLVGFGGRGEGFDFDPGQAYFDNFNANSGNFVPEPTTLALIGLGGVALLRRRRGR